jgi:alkanesulfonate monooxygenase SsuD/methylene tetrahydromethanopterin reductase-like flavin-dependent oxidoreductase (luciferase family)
LAQKETEKIPQLMTDRWLRDVTLFGSVAEVREGIEAWYDTGIHTLIVVPSSAHGNQMVAFQEVFDALR